MQHTAANTAYCSIQQSRDIGFLESRDIKFSGRSYRGRKTKDGRSIYEGKSPSLKTYNSHPQQPTSINNFNTYDILHTLVNQPLFQNLTVFKRRSPFLYRPSFLPFLGHGSSFPVSGSEATVGWLKCKVCVLQFVIKDNYNCFWRGGIPFLI